MISDNPIFQALDRAARARGPIPVPDPAQVERELRAYLVQRGQQMAQDQGLDQATPEELEELGRLDCIAQHPTLDPVLATHLEMIAAKRAHNPLPSWHQDRDRHRGHRHAANETCQVQDQDQTAPEPGTTGTPEIPGMGVDRGLDQGQGDHTARGEPETPGQNEKFDRKRYWERITRDRPDEEWSPS